MKFLTLILFIWLCLYVYGQKKSMLCMGPHWTEDESNLMIYGNDYPVPENALPGDVAIMNYLGLYSYIEVCKFL